MFQLCCRTCLQQTNFSELRSIFDTYDGFLIRDALIELFQIEVHQTDMLPTICQRCLTKLCTARNIRRDFLKQNQEYQRMTSSADAGLAKTEISKSPPQSTNDGKASPVVESTTQEELKQECKTRQTNVVPDHPKSSSQIEDASTTSDAESFMCMLERVDPIDVEDSSSLGYELKIVSGDAEDEAFENYEIIEYALNEADLKSFEISHKTKDKSKASATAEIEKFDGSEDRFDSHSQTTIQSFEEQEEMIVSDLNLPYICPTCDHISENFEEFEEHNTTCNVDQTSDGKHFANQISSHRRNRQKRSRAKKKIDDQEKTENTFTCANCSGAFATKTQLLQHILSVHTEASEDAESKPVTKRITTSKKGFHCRYCPKSFHSGYALMGHENTHTRQQSFDCSVCGKSFAQYTSMRRHVKIHTEVKSHECDICNTRFRQRSVMLAHRRRHTGEKPYLCELCNKSFRDHSTFSKHRRVHMHKCKANIDHAEET